MNEPPFVRKTELTHDARENMQLKALRAAQDEQRKMQVELIRLHFCIVARENNPTATPDEVMQLGFEDAERFIAWTEGGRYKHG